MNDRSSRKKSGGRKRSGGRGDAGAANKSGAKKRGKGRSRSRSKKVDLVKYWGDPATLPDAGGYKTSTPDPSIVINSLGRPPIPGHENASKHYFNLVYERATNLAVALAAAGGLNDPARLESTPDSSNDSLDGAADADLEPENEPMEQP